MERKTLLLRPQVQEKNLYVPNQLVTIEDLDRFRDELLKEIKWLLIERHRPSEKQWLKSGEVRKLLQISPGTLQHLRDSGKLPFTKLGGIIYYERQAIQGILGTK